MYGKVNKPSPLFAAQTMFENEDSTPLDSECMSRIMTPEDWEKYGPLNPSESKKMKKLKYQATY